EKKRSALAFILLILLLIIILILLFYAASGKLWNKNGAGKGSGSGTGGGTDTAAITAKRIADSLRADSLRKADSLRRRADSLKGRDDSLRRRADSLRLALAALKRTTRSNADSLDSLRMAEEARRIADSIAEAEARRIADSIAEAEARRIADSIADAEARRIADSIADAEARRIADSIANAEAMARRITDSIRLAEAEAEVQRIADSIQSAEALRDSLRMVDSLANIDSAAIHAAACARDTVAPAVYADPSGGLHKKAVSVKLVANKACKVEWSIDGVKNWKVYSGKPIDISKNATLYYRAVDNCGRVMNIKGKRYEFDMSAPRCPANMELVKNGNREICVDVYEWPNKKGAVPQAYVSLYQAMDSCFSIRKRLCTSEEWTAACGGPEHWAYTYGDVYEWNTCATRDTLAHRSGSKPECRGYFGLFDMSGNLAEWTSTPAPQDRSFNNVMGGFWTSGDQSRCSDARYSYFPQNKHNPVGFRCCVDAPPAAGGGR
ncbi:MAG: SUMF1/EgtB/PvdO family nonheme iron enzyme, partial [Chitinispirillales bacterium]|nr:SUMF1/EgtB/PvdO family nonheme iron enzyme [Chitinispirillales bacterium]